METGCIALVRIKVIKLSSILYFIVVLLLIIGILFFTFKLIRKKPEDIPTFASSEDGRTQEKQSDNNSNNKKEFAVSLKNLRDPKNILIFQMPFIKGFIYDNKEEAAYANTSRGDSTAREEKSEKEAAKEGKAKEKASTTSETADEHDTDNEVSSEPEIFLKSEPKISKDIGEDDAAEIRIKVSNIIEDTEPIKLTGEGPQIMIYHSHSRESYRQPNPGKAVETFYSTDQGQNVVKVGDVLAQELTKKGIPVLHDRTDHEDKGHDNGYSRSIETLKKRRKEYPSLKIFIDIHRDAFKKGTRTPDQEIVVINGERVAKVMAVIGTGKGQYKGFSEKPKWEENYKFANKITSKLHEKYSGLVKPIYVRSGRFNQHISTQAILFEVGSNMTTLEEAERAAKYIAEAISEIVK